MIDRYLYFVYVIFHGDVVIIILLLVSIIGKLCSRLSHIDSKAPVKRTKHLNEQH